MREIRASGTGAATRAAQARGVTGRINRMLPWQDGPRNRGRGCRHGLPGPHVIALEGALHLSSALAHAAEKSTGDVRGGLHGWSPSVGDFSAFHFSQICRASASQSDSPSRSALPEHENTTSSDAIAAPRITTKLPPNPQIPPLFLPQLAGAPRASRSCAPSVFPLFALRANGEDASLRDWRAGAERHERLVVARPDAAAGLRFLAHALRHAAPHQPRGLELERWLVAEAPASGVSQIVRHGVAKPAHRGGPRRRCCPNSPVLLALRARARRRSSPSSGFARAGKTGERQPRASSVVERALPEALDRVREALGA
jgi:hypothetical protein